MRSVSSPFPLTGIDLQIPYAVASHIVLSTIDEDGKPQPLSAPEMRLALVLIAHAVSGVGTGIEKPTLEAAAGVALDNAARLLAPVARAIVERPYDPDDRPHENQVRVFEAIDYQRGAQGKSVGIVTAKLSVGMQYAMTSREKPVAVAADELRHYSSVGGIILRLRLGSDMSTDVSASVVSTVITPAELGETFGSYASMADIKRKSARTGEIGTIRSLARAHEKLVEPAVKDINRLPKAMRVESSAVMDGTGGGRRPWAAINIVATRVVPVRKPKSISDIRKSPPSIALKGAFRPRVPTKQFE